MNWQASAFGRSDRINLVSTIDYGNTRTRNPTAHTGNHAPLKLSNSAAAKGSALLTQSRCGRIELLYSCGVQQSGRCQSPDATLAAQNKTPPKNACSWIVLQTLHRDHAIGNHAQLRRPTGVGAATQRSENHHFRLTFRHRIAIAD
jgi:hypothetical protein